jgi:ABC-type phosphate/phosphonate transport system ATPase subunit
MELQIRGVSKTYLNGVHALKDVTLTIPAARSKRRRKINF